MNKAIIVLMLLTIESISCRNTAKEIDQLKIAKQYYKVLEDSDDTAITALLTDSLLTKESDYEQTFSQAAYVEWLQWDAVFEPTYKTLSIAQENGTVKAQISKIDKRILFLHERPIVTHQLIRFDKDKIISVETTDYVNFDATTFVKNREKLLRWIDENHPERGGFIYDQTEKGGLNYLKAIELYQKAH